MFIHAVETSQPLEIEYRIQVPGGKERVVMTRAGVVYDEGKQPIRTVGIIQEVTVQRQDEQAKRQAGKLEAVGRLASGIAHDFNNVLTAVLGYMDLLLKTPELTPQAAALVRTAATTAERGSSLTRQLVAFGRSQPLQVETLELNSVLSEAGQMLERTLGEDISLKLVFCPGMPRVAADRGSLEQALMALVFHAREVMPEGGFLVIQTGVEEFTAANLPRHPGARLGRFVWFSLTDSGQTIPSEILPHLFDPCSSEGRPGQSAGLGLPSANRIVKSHQGWIDVTAREPQGNCFRVYLPAEAPARARPSTRSSQEASGEEVSGTPTVLLVEDENALRPLAAALLASFGYRVLEAASGPDALKIWFERSAEIDVLFTDMVMPGGISGKELAALLRAERPGLKVLVTSGHTPDFVDPELRQGVGFLPKPYSAAKLSKALQDCLALPSF
jgi:signal transduction histidine kinase